MRTERVTFLTSREHKDELDAFAASRGESVGNVVREATAQYIGQPTAEEEAELAALIAQVNKAIPEMNASIDSMIKSVRGMRRNIRETLDSLSTRA